MLICMAVQLGVQFPFPDTIFEYFDFILNGGLALLTLASLILGYPFTLQHVRETVPRAQWRQGRLKTSALLSTGLFIFVLVTNTLLYLIPVAKGKLDSPTDPLNFVFRIVSPDLHYMISCPSLASSRHPLP